MESIPQHSMKNGICPACGSSEVHEGTNFMFKGSSHNVIPFAFMRFAPLDNYVCVNCGYVEQYIGNRAHLEAIRKKWPKVKG